MLHFTLKNGQLLIQESDLTVSAFNDIWQYDTSKNKTKAMSMLQYVFHMCDLTDSNPLRDMDSTEKEKNARLDAFRDKDYKMNHEERALIDRAMAWYTECTLDSVQRFGIGLDHKIDEMSRFMQDPANQIKTNADMQQQGNYIATFKNLLAAKKAADEFIKSERTKVKTKGNSKRSPLAAGNLRYSGNGG